MVASMYVELYQELATKMLDEILKLEAIKDNEKTYVWLDKHCFAINKKGEEVTVSTEGVSSFTDIIFVYTNDRANTLL